MTNIFRFILGLFRFILGPLKVINKYKLEFFIWFIFSIFAAQLGILANIIIRYYTYSIPVTQSIFLDSQSGVFYTFSIAIAASALGPLFAKFIKNKKPTFSSIKIVTIILIIFFLIISGFIYASVQSKYFSEASNVSLVIDSSQFAIYLISIFIAVYAFCLLKIESPEYDYLEDSFDTLDDEKVKQVVSQSNQIVDDGTGVKL